jgi:hypothetical protein
MPMCKWLKWPEQGQQGRLDMKKWIVILSMACAAPTLAAPPPPISQPLPGARQATPELAPRQIIERATARAGGETWRRPRTLYLEGYGIFYGPQGAPLINQRHRMWRIYPDFKPNAHNADGKVRIVSERDGKVVSFSAFDGARTYGLEGPLPPSAADRQWAENFGFGVIRYALDEGYQLDRQPDDLVDGQPVYRIQVTDPSGATTLFGIAQRDFLVLSVGFATTRGWHERIYSNFYTKPGVSWVQPGRVRLLYNGVKQNEIIWRDFSLNQPMDDRLFDTVP